MLVYLYYFVYFYPLVYYSFTLYRIVEYYSFAKKICSLGSVAFYKAFNQVKQSEEIEEIYQIISMTEPDKTIDDTAYVSYFAGEETVHVKDNYFLGVDV